MKFYLTIIFLLSVFRPTNGRCPDIDECEFRPEELDAVNLGKVAESWKEARDICSNYEDGHYTLPIPDSIQYHDYISNLASDETEIPLGFSDELEEGNWINIYTSEWMNQS